MYYDGCFDDKRRWTSVSIINSVSWLMLSKEVFLSLIMILPLIQRSIIGDFLSRNTSRIVDEKSSKDVLTRAEFERNLCEEELYRLRFGIENILSNIEEFDKSILTSKSFSAATKKKMNFSTSSMFCFYVRRKSKKNFLFPNWDFPGSSWFERCSFCCRRWRRKTSNDELVDNSLKEKLRDLIPTSRNSKEENRFHSSSENQRLLMKILEVKALDCLCSDYSKRRAHKELRRALSHVERRFAFGKFSSHWIDFFLISPSRSRKSSKTSSRRKGYRTKFHRFSSFSFLWKGSTSRSKSNV